MAFEPIPFDKYKIMDDEKKQAYIKWVAETFQDKICGLMPIDGSEIFEFGGMQPPELVDFGLPSGNLWATTNIGASTPYEPGLYFAWGDINGYDKDENHLFLIEDYIWNDDKAYSKYNEKDGISSLLLEDDAANVDFGGRWHIPNAADFEELLNYTQRYYDSINNVVTFYDNKSELQFCFGGFIDKQINQYGNEGFYWSNQLENGSIDNALGLTVTNKGDANVGSNKRFVGQNIRPIYSQK